ncbi:AraC family transcriptional regulator [Yokenella regensburgei]|uniref:AraC family transcriptional regulator n=1 Tax=Yokenella regensburgei TaxID=158877 RepID=UPI0013761029|nr:helix-turn-helix transcriptional regulator [Yokenella regensburgei]KAF1370531.1 AraC-like DNA-binding protein [Yokenella regensburgei]
MAWLNAEATFNPDSLQQPVIGVQSELGDHDSGLHRHRMGQLMFTRAGCIRLTMHDGETLCLLPPMKVAWIPGGVSHRAEMRSTVDYRSIWFEPAAFMALPKEAKVLNVTPLLRELLERIAATPFDADWQASPERHLAALCVAELENAQAMPMTLRFPQDKRLSALTGDELPPPLHVLAGSTGASERTITRLFLRDTGLSYQQWRQQWRLMKAVELLATGARVTDVASHLAFASDSAFIQFFRTMTGTTPREYVLQQPAAI